ncbi:hypothetical protein BJ165DRAFT_1405417 [Panaeolus papilionaceus]|nr:hypothetical protein BJ165DRAFT_1405417 [Panaeolus papilionaceus]
MQSKHSQVQILEAATILSYRKRDINELLPDDKTEWPSFLSGGSLPKTDAPKLNDEESKVQARGQPQSMPLGYGYSRRATSASYTAAPNQMPVRKVEAVPIALSVSRNSNSSVSASAPGPRLREFAIPTTAASAGPGGVVVVPHGLAPTHVKDEVEDVDVDVDDEDQDEQRRRGADDDDIDIDIDVEEERAEEGVKERTYDVMSLHIDGVAHRTHVRSSSMRSSSSPRNPGLTGSASASSGDDEDEDVELELEGPAVPARDYKKRDVPGYGSAPSAYGYSTYGYPYPHASSYVSAGYAYAGYPASSGAPAAATGYGIGSYGSTSGPGYSPSSYHARSGSYSATFGGAWGSVREEEEDEEEDVNGRVSAVRGRGRYASREDDDMDVSSKVRATESGSRWDGMEMDVDNMDMD